MQALTTYFQAIWRCRYFWLSLVKVDLRKRYRGSAIGFGWSLLNPILMTVILCVVFSTIWKQDIVTFAPYVMAGLTFWQFLTKVTLEGCQCFFNGETYIRQYPAPMAIYPLRATLGAGVHFGLAFLLVLGLGFYANGAIDVLAWLSLVPTFLLLLIFGWSVAILFGLVCVRFRDTHHLSEVGLQALMYLTPIMYPEDLILKRRTVGWIVQLNPLLPFLHLLREPVCNNAVPGASVFLAASLITLLTATAAALALKSEERKIIFNL